MRLVRELSMIYDPTEFNLIETTIFEMTPEVVTGELKKSPPVPGVAGLSKGAGDPAAPSSVRPGAPGVVPHLPVC